MQLPLGDQRPVMYLDFSKENWSYASMPGRTSKNLIVRDLVGQHDFTGEEPVSVYRPAVCKNSPGKAVLQIDKTAVRQMLDSKPNNIPLRQGEDFTIVGWFRYDPKVPDSQMIFSQRDKVGGDSFGQEVSWNLNFDGNASGNSYYFIMNRQALGQVTAQLPLERDPAKKFKTFAEQPNFYDEKYADENFDRYLRYKAYHEYHDYMRNLWMATEYSKPSASRNKNAEPQPRKNLNPMKPVQPGLPPVLPIPGAPQITPPETPPTPPIVWTPYPPVGPLFPGPPPVPPDDYPPPPPIPIITPAPIDRPPPYSNKDHVYMDHGFGGDSAATCLSHNRDNGEIRKECWHFIAISYTFQDPQGPHAEIYFYRVNPFSQMIEVDRVRHVPRDGLEASRPINLRNNFFRIGGVSSGLFKDVAIYKKALSPVQVEGFVKQTAPIGKSYSCDYSDMVGVDIAP